MSVLVVYASRHASTRGIAERIGTRLRELGWDAEVAPVGEVHTVEPYAAVVVGSAVHFGRWLRPAAEFVRRNRPALTERPVWLFSSGPVSEMPEEEPEEAAALGEAIRARDHRVFSGALHRDGLGLAERLAARAARAARAADGDFRDWHDIDAWAESIASEVSAA